MKGEKGIEKPEKPVALYIPHMPFTMFLLSRIPPTEVILMQSSMPCVLIKVRQKSFLKHECLHNNTHRNE